ncbi:hypothetical protein EYB26_005975 [Talaromyces marneffei]|uniref:uncharacterized protein n=1 Tax=Talaromyces marneffei TaxID=37727 RepID=UPI0012A8C17D|nr:uncharacterized protein EYB26_005975 [Talaromyces marneffei]QGA18291.1 hypothetical protein EYB26_005975 [Talaromyces marneffei]
MASNEGNVAALEVNEDADNVETVTTSTPPTTTTTTTVAVPETTTATENIPTPSASAEPAAEIEAPKEKENGEELSNFQAATATSATTTAPPAVASTAEDIPAAIQPTSISTDGPKSEGPEAVNITERESSDQTQLVKETAEEAGPELVITLLLTTGARHPFKIDKKYLKRRSVKVENDDPFNMSVYTLKELIWREWRSEWEPQPSSPSSIRLISFGKLLDDKSPLSESSLTHDAPNVIHMTVKPQEVVDEEDAKGGKSYSTRDRETTDRSPGCRCVII